MRGAAVTWPANLDAAELVRNADAHGATPLIAWQLRRNPQLGLPAEAVTMIEASARAMTTLDVVRRHAVDELLDRFASARIPLLVIKGAALARTHYPHSSLRPRCDVDVFIDEASRSDVVEVLQDSGYHEESGSGGELISRQRMWVRMDAVGVRHCVDLHWALSNRQRYAATFSFGELWSRGVELRGSEVRMPSPADALLIAAMHLDGHHRGNERLIWLYDIHLLHGTIASRELQAAALLARERNLDLPLDVAIALALRWFGDGHGEEGASPAAVSEIEVLVDDLRFTPGLRRKMRLMREHLFPPAAYVMQKYGVRSRTVLPALYLRRAVARLLRH
jgi:Uncharacterised nucleotidyltransferase